MYMKFQECNWLVPASNVQDMLHSTCSLLPVLVHLRSRSSRKKSAPFAAGIKAFALLAQCTKCAEVMEVVVAGAAAIKKKTFRG
jgi:hypothetical protein